jgi:uncharacterized membrane protein
MDDHWIRCPACGHQLSMFEEADVARSERVAAAIADHVATWWFAGTVLALLSTWITVNVVWRPFEPYPVVTLAVISAALACVTALQGPLILVTQRRAAERDRMRDREALRVATNTEGDLHTLSTQIARLVQMAEAPEPSEASEASPT